MNSKQIVSLIGSAVVFIGCCLPVLNSPDGISVSYMFGSGYVFFGLLLVALVALGVVAAFRDNVNLLIMSIIFASLIFGFTWILMSGLLDGSKGGTGISTASIGLRSGGIAIVSGLAIMFGSAAVAGEKRAVKTHTRKRTKHKLHSDNIHRQNVRRNPRSSSIFKSRSKNRRGGGDSNRRSTSK